MPFLQAQGGRQSAPARPEGGEGRTGALLRMAIGSEAVALPIEDVREILEVGRLTALPRTPAFVRGVMNLRGAVVPVIDLQARLGGEPAQIGRRSCVVVVEAGGALAPDAHDEPPDGADDGGPDSGHDGRLVVGLLVDAVYEVFEPGAEALEPVPVLGTRIAAQFLLGMGRLRNEVIGVLDLARVLAQAELSALIAAHAPH